LTVTVPDGTKQLPVTLTEEYVPEGMFPPVHV
jgi:hypothetical protein